MYLSKVKIPVKIGSHSIMVTLNDKSLTCEKFISLALKQSNLKTAAKQYLSTYALIECSNGVDRVVPMDECMYDLWCAWKHETQLDVEFVIKKFKQPKLASKSVVESYDRSTSDNKSFTKKFLSKIYKKARSESGKLFSMNSKKADSSKLNNTKTNTNSHFETLKSSKMSELLAQTEQELKENQDKLKSELQSLLKMSKSYKRTMLLNDMIESANKRILSKIEELKSFKFESNFAEIHIYEEIIDCY